MTNLKTNQGHEISQIKCKFYHLIYNNYKPILIAATGRASRKLRVVKLL